MNNRKRSAHVCQKKEQQEPAENPAEKQESLARKIIPAAVQGASTAIVRWILDQIGRGGHH